MQTKEKKAEPQVITDYKTKIFKLYHRPGLRIDQRLKNMNDLATKFATGWPFGDKSAMSTYGQGDGYRNELERLARTLHELLKRQDLVANGRNLGKTDKTELDSAKVYSGDKKTAE